jgi:hypothetical protein
MRDGCIERIHEAEGSLICFSIAAWQPAAAVRLNVVHGARPCAPEGLERPRAGGAKAGR